MWLINKIISTIKNLLLRGNNNTTIESSFFDANESDSIDRINYRNAIRRLVRNQNKELLLDPLRLNDIQWYVNQYEAEFKQLIKQYYYPNKKITLNMPKNTIMFRPVSFLLPIDSLFYLSLVEIIVKYKRDKFSSHVYSNKINEINNVDVFHNPVQHWLRMRANLRTLFRAGSNLYFTADISGYFENIKLNKLITATTFYAGRNEQLYLSLLQKLLSKWQYAEAQGLIQTHPASSILGKIYLTSVDSQLARLGNRYSRYVDEFHIMGNSRREIIRISIEISEALRELGLNLNASKTRLLEGSNIEEEIDEARDFFEMVNYLEDSHLYEDSLEYVRSTFRQLEIAYNARQQINIKVFRRCIHIFASRTCPDGIDFSFRIIENFQEQTIDIIRYLRIFINDPSYHRIIDFFNSFLEDHSRNLYKWQQIWVLSLLLEVIDINNLRINTIWSIATSRDQDDLSRSIAFLILTKHLQDNELIILREQYLQSTSLILRRTLLFCLSKLPPTYTQEIMAIDRTDDITIQIIKRYLAENPHPNHENYSLL